MLLCGEKYKQQGAEVRRVECKITSSFQTPSGKPLVSF